jgi:ribosome-associated toxin RatA of RatAB toxin-antitoxin module
MKTRISVHVAAPPERVFALARDVARWPELLPHYRRVAVKARRGERVLAQMVALRPVGPFGVPVTWRAEQWAEPDDPTDLRLRFRHVRGVTRGMHVTWHIVPAGDGSRVTIEHDFRRPLPLVGGEFLPGLVDRFFTRPIATRTLQTFKALAETSPEHVVAGVTGARAEPGPVEAASGGNEPPRG